ncbi:MAG: heparinase II/III family protein [Hyphomonadaceae bacterium]|nr:heparinase II/III family protein [Hyphomonadaceae bacterium]
MGGNVYFGPTFEDTQAAAVHKIEAQMSLPVIVPVPEDAGGGYTHEKHKENARLIYNAGQLYTLTGKEKYADFAAGMMGAYADVYPGWGIHPARKEQSPGRMFWQNLNESWWLVHVSQAYGAVRDTLSDAQKDHIEQNLLRNMANFLSVESPETFDRIHNHGTWATAAVGMTGYAIGDRDYSEKALLGLDKSGESGFLKQLDELFSPDGYYHEGPYYQRYALMPFVLFARAVSQNEPERAIFRYRDGILEKAIYAVIHQNYAGLFFPINDAIKDKSIATTELLHGVSIAYELTGDPELLSIAEAQGKFALTPEGRAVSDALKSGKSKPFSYRSMRLTDGAQGDQGALDILRASRDPDGLAVVAKNTSQGLGHGHFDKLGILIYDAGREVLRDYGAARFLNVEAKYGGHYLPENNAYAKQTVAHNALVVDSRSHFNADVKTGNKNAPEPGAFEVSDDLIITSASIDTVYAGVSLSRTVAIVKDATFPEPIIIDLVKAHAGAAHSYDLPFHYNGHPVNTNLDVQADPVSRIPLGTDNGYQYLWKVAETDIVEGLSQVTWMLDRKFYTVTTLAPDDSKVVFFQIGANDPNFNLRNEPGFMLRATADRGVVFASVFEPHGEYNPVVEYTLNSYSRVSNVTHFNDGNVDFIRVATVDGDEIGLGVAEDMAPDMAHVITVDGREKSWIGPYHLFHSKSYRSGDR